MQGLTRVRSFCQDDAHIFCTPQQIGAEIDALFDSCSGSTTPSASQQPGIYLSTKPEKSIGEPGLWEHAEAHPRAVPREARRAVHDQPRRRRLLRPEDRLRGARRDRPRVAARHHPARLPAAGALRPVLRRRGRQRAAPGDDPPRHPRLDRAFLRRHARALRRRPAAVAGAGAGARAAGVGQASSTRRARCARRSPRRGCASRSTSAPRSSAPRSATASSPKVPVLLIVGRREAESGGASVRLRHRGDLGARPPTTSSRR